MPNGDRDTWANPGGRQTTTCRVDGYYDPEYRVWVPCDQPSPDPQEGRKFDKEKPRVDLLPGDALLELAQVLGANIGKHGERSWERGKPWSKDFGSLLRHLWAWWGGEELDKESGLPHLAHAGCRILFLIAYSLRNKGLDDRSIL